jgi:SAM-dependent methyltransferase
MDSLGTCPRCLARLEASPCGSCGLAFESEGGIVDALGARERERAAAEVESFYSRSPFPGYAPGDDAGTLLDRSRRAPFLRALDAAVPSDARVIDCGSGTSQLAAFLALSGPRRNVFALDGCRASLGEAARFRARVSIPNLTLVRADLFDMPVRAESFSFVVSRGVVHHTPDPSGAIRGVARLVARGGFLMLGFYESRARLFHRLRMHLARLAGRPLAFLDPLLRARDLDPEKRRIWIEDQYRHPLERLLPLPAVLRELEELGFEWVRTVPPALEGTDRGLFHAVPRPSAMGMSLLRNGWALRGVSDPDAGLVCLIARRREGSRPHPRV